MRFRASGTLEISECPGFTVPIEDQVFAVQLADVETDLIVGVDPHSEIFLQKDGQGEIGIRFTLYEVPGVENTEQAVALVDEVAPKREIGMGIGIDDLHLYDGVLEIRKRLPVRNYRVAGSVFP